MIFHLNNWSKHFMPNAIVRGFEVLHVIQCCLVWDSLYEYLIMNAKDVLRPVPGDISIWILFDLCWNFITDEAGGTSDEDLCCGEMEAADSTQESPANREGDNELKETLMRKYSGYLSSLRKEFLKKRKKGKLPKDARTALLEWWNTHYRWPYPTVISTTSWRHSFKDVLKLCR